jgi:Na+/H+ antiporter NhaD/arsenite permease-like protein
MQRSEQALDRKHVIGILIIFAYAVAIFTVPLLANKQLAPILATITLVMITVYVLLALEIIHRSVLAILGAIIAVISAIFFGTINADDSLDFIVESIDFNTIGLLLGMMIIVAILGETGIFYWVGIKAGKISKGNLWKLMLLLCSFTAVASMFIDNVTTILLMVPVTLSITRTLRVPAIPFILAQVLVSNIGGAATLIGDPPNILIGSAADIDFNSFLVHMGLPIAITYVFCLFLLRFFFRRELKEDQIIEKPSSVQELLERDEEAIIVENKDTLKKALIVLVGVIALFSLQGITHIEVSIVAIGGAAVLLVITRVPLDKILHEVDWPTLFFFAGLFVIVGVAEAAGLINVLANIAIGITGGNPWLTFIMVIWLSGVGSAFVDNIPLTATMIPVIQSVNSDPTIAAAFGAGSGFQFSPLWWALALGADLGGNGTLIGSSAGVVAIGLSEKFGHHITFNRWFKIGFPFMLITLAVGTVILAAYLLLLISR